MMKIAFFNIAHECLAVSILSAIAKQEGHEVKLFHSPNLFKDGSTREFPRLAKLFSHDKEIFKQLVSFKPDIIAFSVVTFHYKTALDYAKICREICPGAKIVFGGIHVSSVPDVVIANDSIDYAVIGEGEQAFVEIINHIEKGCPPEPIVNTWYKTKDKTVIKGKQIGFIQDLDSLPHYDMDIWQDIFPLHKYYLTMTSRGCPYNCSYCFNHFFKNLPDEKSNYLRRRSVRHVIEELKTSKERYKLKVVEFWDDIFIFERKWLKEFLEAYKKEIHVPFKCYIHVNLFDEEMAIRLKDAGCQWVDFGIQSINEDYRKKYLNRNETNADIVNAIKLLKKHGIVSFADYIVGMPGDAIEHYEEARQFFIENMPDIIEVYWMSYHPRTEIIKKGFEHQALSDEMMHAVHCGEIPCGYFERSRAPKDFHKEYYFIFKVLPALPLFLREKLTYELSKKIPEFIKQPFLICCFFYLSWRHGNPRLSYVTTMYLRQIMWMLRSKFFRAKNA